MPGFIYTEKFYSFANYGHKKEAQPESIHQKRIPNYETKLMNNNKLTK
jgi:hypothetical protein